MNGETNLSLLKPGECATVEKLTADASMRRRLLDIGLVKGTQVECLGTAPCGEIAAYLIRGAVIAIRDEDSSRVIVKMGGGV